MDAVNKSVGIDPGHGGADPGAVRCGLVERDRVEVAAEQLHTHLLARGLLPVHTRRVGEDPWFITRGLRTRGCICVVSLHINSGPFPAANGMELYYWPGSAAGLTLAREIAMRCPPLLCPTGLQGPRVIAAYDDPSTARDDWIQHPRSVLRRHRPCAVLAELGYASNDANRSLLMSDCGLESAVIAVAEGVQAWIAALPASTTDLPLSPGAPSP